MSLFVIPKYTKNQRALYMNDLEALHTTVQWSSRLDELPLQPLTKHAGLCSPP